MAGLVGALALIPARPANAGLYLEHEVLTPNPADATRTIKETVRTWYEGRRMKRESPLRGDTVVVDLEQGEVYSFHARDKTWWRMPADRYQRMAAVALVAMGVTIGPDGQPRVPDPLFVETHQESSIEGRRARELRVAAPGVPGLTMTVWISKDPGLPRGALGEHMRIAMGGPQGAGYDALFARWTALGGYPVQNVTTVRTPGGSVMSSETLLVLRQEKIPVSAFTVPAGFTLVDDPITAHERSAAGQGPAGIGAPLGAASGSGAGSGAGARPPPPTGLTPPPPAPAVAPR